MIYGILADIVVISHLLFIVFVVLGALLTLKWRWTPLLHLPAVAWGAYIEFQSIVCPLTPLEQYLRNMAGEKGYSGGFIDHYLLPIIYPPGLDISQQIVLGVLAIVINVVMYGFVLFSRLRYRTESEAVNRPP